MKSTLILASLLIALPACAPRKKVTQYIENPYDNSNNEQRLSQLEQQVLALQSAVNANIVQINSNSSNITQLQSQLSSEVNTLLAEISAVKEQIQDAGTVSDTLAAQLDSLEQQLQDAISAGGSAYTQIMSQISGLQSTNTTLNSSVTSLQSSLAQLQSSERVIGIIDPCPNSAATYKEVLFKMNSGKFIAYFESGSQRFMTVLLQNVNYQTTDSRACQFYINSNNEVKTGAVPSSLPTGATHKLSFCSIDAYKVPGGLNYNGVTYNSSFTANNCNVVVNNTAENVSVNGCNYNNVSSLQTGANVGTGCSVTKL